MRKRRIRFKYKGRLTNEQLAMRLWHFLLGDDRTPEDQRIWRTSDGPDVTWSLSNNDWFLSNEHHQDDTGFEIYVLRHRYGYEEIDFLALARTLKIVVGVQVIEIS